MGTRKERFKLIPSVYLILLKDNKILLLRRYNTGFRDGEYSFIAGHLDGNETLRQAMVREAKEEANIELNSADLELVHTMNRNETEEERIDFFFTAKKWEGEPKIMEPHKCDDLRWFETNNLPDNIIPYIKQVIDSVSKNMPYSEFGY